MEWKQILLKARPKGLPNPTSDFEIKSIKVPSLAELKDGEYLAQVVLLSCDPTQRGWMQYDTYLPAIKLGDVVRSGGYAVVIASKNEKFRVGDRVSGMVGWQTHFVGNSKSGLGHAPAAIAAEAFMSDFGMTTVTAYFGLRDIGKPKPGDTLVVSGASGATGSAVVQIGKIMGCRVVAITGSEDKCAALLKQGADVVVNYTLGNLSKKLREACPKGVDVFFDNVGGDQLDAVLGLINRHARIVICGAIAGYNDEPLTGIRRISQLVVKEARMEGFLVLSYYSRVAEVYRDVAAWIKEGRFSVERTVLPGFEQTPHHFLRLFSGDKMGKLLVRVSDDPQPRAAL